MIFFKSREEKKIFEFIDNLSIEDFEFRIETTKAWFIPKNLICSSAKIKADNLDFYDITPKIFVDVDCFFLNKLGKSTTFRVNSDDFESFKDKYRQYDKVETETVYLRAVFVNENKKKELYKKIICYLYSKFGNVDIADKVKFLRDYGFLYWNIPFLVTNEEKSNDKEKLIESIKEYFKNLIR